MYQIEFTPEALDDLSAFKKSEQEEVKSTSQNKKLMKFLVERRTPGKRIPIEKVREQLGLSLKAKG